jgi:allantoin racemase
MKLLVINPNTTASMTAKIGAAARAVAAPGTEIRAVNPADGPVSIEGPYDEAYCLPGLLHEVRQGRAQNVDATIIACFDDPGLIAARTIAGGPVVGICEAAMLAASMIAHRFSVVTTLACAVPVIEHLALNYGMERRCASVRAADVPVLALEEPGGEAAHKVAQEVKRAIAEDGAEAVLLGCAGMADLTAWLTRETGVPVIDGVAAAVKLAEALVGLGLKTSQVGLYSPPQVKPYSGRFSDFAPGSGR